MAPPLTCGKGIVWSSTFWSSTFWSLSAWSNTSIYDCVYECDRDEDDVMIDIHLTQENGIYDFVYCSKGDFSITSGFDTSLLMSLFCERRALPSEVPDAIRRRGWIGNRFYNEDGFENGSKLWIQIEQGRITNNVLNAVKNAAQIGLEWLISDNYAKKTTAEIINDNGVIKLKITITVSSSKIEERFFDIWSKTGL